MRESEGALQNYSEKVRDLISAWHLRGAPRYIDRVQAFFKEKFTGSFLHRFLVLVVDMIIVIIIIIILKNT